MEKVFIYLFYLYIYSLDSQESDGGATRKLKTSTALQALDYAADQSRLHLQQEHFNLFEHVKSIYLRAK